MKKVSFLFALLCASVMSFAAIDWSGYTWLGNGSGDSNYTDKIKVATCEGMNVVNLQKPGFAAEAGIYATFPQGITATSLGDKCAIQGAGVVLYLSAFTAKETEVTVTAGSDYIFTVYYEDGIEGGTVDPVPAVIDVVNYPSVGYFNFKGTVEGKFTSQKYDANTTAPTDAITFPNGFSADGVNAVNYVSVRPAEGGFLPGDTVKVVAYFNNSDETKAARLAFYNADTVSIDTLGLFINGRTVAGVPPVQQFVLTEATDSIFIGRVGRTGEGVTRTNMLSLVVSRKYVPKMKGEYKVGGASADYATLAAAIKDLEEIGMEGNVDLLICADLKETENTSLVNQTDYTLTIRPDKAEMRTIEYGDQLDNAGPSGHITIGYDLKGWAATPTKNVVIDGSFNGEGQYLTIKAGDGTNAGVLVLFYGKVTNSVVKNCRLLNERTTKTNYITQFRVEQLVSGTDPAPEYRTDNSPVGVGFENCYMQVTGVANTQAVYYNGAVAATAKVGGPKDCFVKNCEIVTNLRGIFFNGANGAIIEGNIFRLPSASPGFLAHGIMGNSQTGVISVRGNQFLELKTNNINEGDYGIQAVTASGGADVWIIDNNYFTGLDALGAVSAKKIKLAYVRCGDSCVVRHNTFFMPQFTNHPATAIDATAPISCLYLAGARQYVVENNYFVSDENTSENSLIRGAMNPNVKNNVFAISYTDKTYINSTTPMSRTWEDFQTNQPDVAATCKYSYEPLAGVSTYKFQSNDPIEDMAVPRLNDVLTDIEGKERPRITYAGCYEGATLTQPARIEAPDQAAPAPTWPEAQVKAMYAPKYNADMNFADWGSGTVYTQEEYGKKFVTTNSGYFGTEGFALNCLNMEYLHYDIWVADDASIRIVPIWGGTEQGIIVDLKGQEWNKIDIAKEEYTAITNWSNIYQVKIDQAMNLTLWIGNAYFYRTTELVDNEAPTEVSAVLDEAYYFSASVKLNGRDNMGAVIYTIYDGEDVVGTTAGASEQDVYYTINDLKAGTTYNFSVVASDDKENKADAVALEVTTLTAPAPAPVPTADAADVLSLYSDAYTFAPASLSSYNEGWWHAPHLAEGEMAEGENALYYYGFTDGMIGWQFAPIDATDYPFFHIDIYPLAAGTIDIGPSYGGEGLETAIYTTAAYQLQANQWNSVEINLTGKNLSSMFQLQLINYYNLGSFFVDNVYFSKTGINGTGVDNLKSGDNVQKIMRDGVIYIQRDGKTYNVMGVRVR